MIPQLLSLFDVVNALTCHTHKYSAELVNQRRYQTFVQKKNWKNKGPHTEFEPLFRTVKKAYVRVYWAATKHLAHDEGF